MRKIFAILLTTALLLTLSACIFEPETEAQPQEIKWNDLKLGEYIPAPTTLLGFITYDYSDLLSVEICQSDKSEYSAYVDVCIGLGFTIEAETASNRYSAYNQDGYKVALTYNDDSYDIVLRAPEEMDEIEWPTMGIATRLPIPTSTYGKVSWDDSKTYSVHIGNITFDQYKDYVKECEAAGFVVDYSRGEKTYRACDSEGYKLTLEYLGFNRILIYITAPENTEQTPTTAPVTTTKPTVETVPDNTTKPDDSELVDGMRPDFKAAMDSYEAFFAEYCDFMKKYKENPTDLGLIMEYAEMMKQYADTMEKMEAWEEDDLNNEELKYYIDVTSRISKMLVDVTG